MFFDGVSDLIEFVFELLERRLRVAIRLFGDLACHFRDFYFKSPHTDIVRLEANLVGKICLVFERTHCMMLMFVSADIYFSKNQHTRHNVYACIVIFGVRWRYRK